MSLESCVGTRGWREGTERGGQWAEGASLHMAKPSPPSWPPAHGPLAPAVPSRPRARSRCRPPNCRWGLRLSIRTLPRGRPPPPAPSFSTGFPSPATRLWAPAASPPWRHASLAWRRSRRVAAGAVRRPRPRSTSPCWAGKDRHPWRRLAGGFRDRRTERDPCRRRSREPRERAWQKRARRRGDARCR